MTEVSGADQESLLVARAVDRSIHHRTVLTSRRSRPEIDMNGVCQSLNREENGLDRSSSRALNRPIAHRSMYLAPHLDMSLATAPVALQVLPGEAPENVPTAEAQQPLRWAAVEILEGVLNHGAFLKCA